jgi:cation diffusion facilitator CzcD-associated flavoprotein CzcO
MSARTRVVILGAGCGGLYAATALRDVASRRDAVVAVLRARAAGHPEPAFATAPWS